MVLVYSFNWIDFIKFISFYSVDYHPFFRAVFDSVS